MTNQEKYVRAFVQGDSAYRVTGVYGRIVRTDLDQPVTLTEDEDRKVVMIMGPSGLQTLLGCSGCDALYKIGYSAEYIARNILRGKKFKLVVFERPQELRIATWSTAVTVVAQHYPEVSPILLRALPELKRRTIEQFEADAGYRFYDARLQGMDDERFMTAERLLQGRGTAADVRRFLFHTVHFSELYTGNGHTRTPEGERGVREYIMRNVRIDSLANWSVADLQVEMCLR